MLYDSAGNGRCPAEQPLGIAQVAHRGGGAETSSSGAESYGQRSSIGSLAIQKLDDFADEPEKAAYRIWLEQNKQRWLAFFQAEGGAAAARWICDNRDALDGNQWGSSTCRGFSSVYFCRSR